jgi:diguanylate cyclase (GGDEF)-like protein/PAS domain S-box-containing protein
MERIFGVKKEEAVGRIILDLLPFLGETGEDRHLLETLRGETVTTWKRPFCAAGTGKEGFLDAHYGPLYDGGGKARGGIAFMRDITERVKAEKTQHATEERYLDLFENANDIVFTHDLEGRITSVNKAAERITGYSRAEMLQMKACELVPPEHLQMACKTLERQVAGESSAPYELEITCKDGRRVALEVSTCIILREGKPFGVQGIARDISERKKTEEALQQAKHNLEAWVHELEQRTHEMTLLSEMGDMLRACLTTDEAYTVIVRVAQQIFPVQVGALYVISPARNLVEAVAVWGDASLIERVFAPDECWALRRGRVHWVEDSSVGLLCKHLSQPIPEGYLCVPMMAQSEALGVLYLAQPADSRLTEVKQRLAVAMAEHIAMALSNLKLHETLRSESLRDPLTGLFNRRFMEESLELELRRAARNRRPVGMITLEVDNLQAVSQSVGEDAENAILLELGRLLQGIIRKEDVACRYSAERFIIILPQGSLEVAAQRAESLRDMTENQEIHHRGRPIGHVTISAGIACFPDHGRTLEALVRASDAALQRAKQEGGDRVVTAQ